jgi:hypothetical protein
MRFAKWAKRRVLAPRPRPRPREVIKAVLMRVTTDDDAAPPTHMNFPLEAGALVGFVFDDRFRCGVNADKMPASSALLIVEGLLLGAGVVFMMLLGMRHLWAGKRAPAEGAGGEGRVKGPSGCVKHASGVKQEVKDNFIGRLCLGFGAGKLGEVSRPL